MDPTLLATAAELKVPNRDAQSSPEVAGRTRSWLTVEDEEDGDFARFVYEDAELSPTCREHFKTACCLDRELERLERLAKEAAEIGEVAALQAALAPSPCKDQRCAASQPFRERLKGALPAEGVASHIDWSRLAAVDTTEALAAAAEESPGGANGRAPACVEINSGGQVFFALLSPGGGGSSASQSGKEEAVVIKFCNSRHLLQSEQLAAELAWHLDIPAPVSRLLLKAHDGEEWGALASKAEALCPELSEVMRKKQSMLVLQYIPGANLQSERVAWEPHNLAASAHAMGRLLLLDLLLGNTDRLPVRSMAWRGNPSNVLWSSLPTADPRLRCAPIDAAIARRPPRLLVQETDNKAACLLELVLLDRRSAHDALLDCISCNEIATSAVEADWAPSESAWAEKTGATEGQQSAVSAFHKGIKSALDLALTEQGLLEMVVDVISSWLANFRADMSEVAHAGHLSNTGQLKKIDREASKDEEVRERLSSWQTLLQQKSIALAQAAREWSARRRADTAPLVFKGFLGESVLNPVTDAYELLVRLRQLIARTKVVSHATSVTRPSDLAPAPLLVGGATAACCFHLLRKLGVTLVVNCTEDLPAPTEEALGGIRWYRLALADTEEQDLSASLEEGLAAIQEAVEAGGRVLVHCHEGKSRSVTVCLAYLLTRQQKPLGEALQLVRSRRKQARPNAGFMRQLMDLELKTLGSNSVTEDDLPKGKPKMLVCEVCGQSVGLTEDALSAHMKSKHPQTPAGN